MTTLLAAETGYVPPLLWVAPFALLLVLIALLPLIPRLAHSWENNWVKLGAALLAGGAAMVHFALRPEGVLIHSDEIARLLGWLGASVTESHGHPLTGTGASAVLGALANSIWEYVPFIVLLFSLYSIAGGITVRGDLPAHPLTNTSIMAIGAVLANLIGTTGAAMLLIRFLLLTNRERQKKAHTVVFFIFIVCNCAGCLLPIGDPPLFLGYLKGVPFFWTLSLWKDWALACGLLLTIYYIWDTIAYRKETLRSLILEETQRQKLRVIGLVNVPWLILVVLAVAFIAPARPFPGTSWHPPVFLRELVMLAVTGLSFLTTPRGLRHASGFSFTPIGEVAALFIGIFIAMQIPLEILSARGAELGLTKPWHFFWATGLLSGVLDNAPTYAVFFQTAAALTPEGTAAGPGIIPFHGGLIREDLLTAVSLGAVFMGAATYIGNGPNFMVKAVAEHAGVKMPGFFGYMLYSALILVPTLLLMELLFVG